MDKKCNWCMADVDERAGYSIIERITVCKFVKRVGGILKVESLGKPDTKLIYGCKGCMEEMSKTKQN